MKPSAQTVLEAIIYHWQEYQAPPTRKWLKEYTALNISTVYMAMSYLVYHGYIHAPKGSKNIVPLPRAKPDAVDPWDQEDVYA